MIITIIIVISMAHGTFATALNCMDGRTQDPVSKYAMERFGVKFVDTITEAGIDGLLPAMVKEREIYKATQRKVLISVNNHGSQGIVVAGHEDCAGNPVEEEKHIADVRKSVEIVREMIKPGEIPVEGVFVTLHPPKVKKL